MRTKTKPRSIEELKLLLINKKFGLLTISSSVGRVNKVQRWECVCDCGKTVTRRTECFINSEKHNLSCGCLNRARLLGMAVKHGQHKTKEYTTWHGIKQRCYNKNNQGYALYGGRGITMSKEWFNDFSVFLKDIGFAPDKDSSIDRINSNGNYEPSNCRWATKTEQSNNTSRNRFFIIDGIRATMAEHARRLKVSRFMVKGRLAIGWDAEEAFKTPNTKLNRCKITGRILSAKRFKRLNQVTISN